MRFFCIFLVLCGFFVGLDHFFHRKPNEFSVLVNALSLSAPQWDIDPLSSTEQREIDQILNQKFTYLAKGSQAYAFLSEDKKYVLKFIKQHILCPNSWLCYVPFPFNPYYQKYTNRKKKSQATYRACQIAFHHCKDATALVYLHLNPTNHLHQTITLYDKRGHAKSLKIDQACFMIQKNADLIYTRIEQLMSKNEIEKAKNIIASVFFLIDFLGKKGVFDNDPNIQTNFGLVDDTAVQIDVGNMKIDPLRTSSLTSKQEVGKIVAPFRTWIQENYPELLPCFTQSSD